MMDFAYVALMTGLFLLSALALRLFTQGQGKHLGREE
jgi:hypothetical protein